MPNLDPTPAIAYAALTGSADVSSAAPLPHISPTTPSANTPFNEQQTTHNKPQTTSHEPSPIPHSKGEDPVGLRDRNPHLLDLSSPAGMDRVRLAAAYIETDLITSCEKRRALDPADPAFASSLRDDAKNLFSVTAVRKTIITLDRYLEDYAEYLAQKTAAQAQSEAEQTRIAAEAEAKAEIRRQAIDRAQELLTRLAAEDPRFRAALDKAGADLAAEFARLRDPQPDPAQARKQIDNAAVQIVQQLLTELRFAHPGCGLDPSSQSSAADRLARAERGESIPANGDDDDDDDDDWDDDEDFEDEDGFNDEDEEEDAPTGSADALVRNHALTEDQAITIEENASTGSADVSSAIAPARPHAPLAPFNPHAAIRAWQSQPTPHNEQQTTNIEPQSPSPRAIPAVPVCPTFSPRRLESVLSRIELAPTHSVPAPAPALSDADPDHSIQSMASPAPDVPNYPVSRIYSSPPRRIPVAIPCAKGPPYGY